MTCWPRWLDIPIIPVLGRLKQKGHEFKTSLGHIVRPCLQTKVEDRQEEKKKEEFANIALEEPLLGKGGLFL